MDPFVSPRTCNGTSDHIPDNRIPVAPTFDLASNHIQQLNFGTCRVFFENFSNHTMTECWSTVVSFKLAALMPVLTCDL